MERAGLKRLLRFPPTFRQTLVELLTSLAGIILLSGLEAFRHGVSVTLGLVIALLTAVSAATGMLIYRERRSWALLKEVRSLTENWRAFCDHCRPAHHQPAWRKVD